ncbi:protein of unknown function [Methylorubrum extorquens]|uniref:Uncharacterized protein n=1 Tax=Methylorubrum extorquens TaxID=408 RepID=A0A2N9AUH5_METEX|nr:protein of unknown function [Methylorubrum extorquens]
MAMSRVNHPQRRTAERMPRWGSWPSFGRDRVERSTWSRNRVADRGHRAGLAGENGSCARFDGTRRNEYRRQAAFRAEGGTGRGRSLA